MWILLAVLSAFFAGVTTVLAKRGIKNADSDVSTAIRTGVVLLMAFLMTVVSGSLGGLKAVGGKNLLFLVLSGFATGASWLCYFKALKDGDVSKVVPIDKSSAVMTMLLSFLLFSEKATVAKICGMVLVAVGIFLMIETKKKPTPPAPLPAGAAGADPATPKGKPADNAGVKNGAALQEPKRAAVGNDALSSMPQAGAFETSAQISTLQTGAFVDGAQNSAAQAGAFETGAQDSTLQTGAAANEAALPAKKSRGWLWYALLSAVFATLTSVLGKAGIDGVESSLGTFIRTAVVLIVSWALVVVKGKGGEVKKISGRDLVFILLSGFATGASWLCYFKALKDGVLSAVTAIDKCSVAFSVGLSVLLFREKISLRAFIGLLILLGGTLCMLS